MINRTQNHYFSPMGIALSGENEPRHYFSKGLIIPDGKRDFLAASELANLQCFPANFPLWRQK
jgi:hypothetical protein